MTEGTYVPSSPRTSEDRLVKRIKALEKRLDDLARRPQLVRAALDDGAVVVTSGGVTTGIFGQQFDGTTAMAIVGGPVPPKPVAPTVAPAIGGLSVTVSGALVDPQPDFASPVTVPQDFARWDVEASYDFKFSDVDPNRPAATIVAPAGGTVLVPWPLAKRQVYVRVVMRSQSGKRSAPSLFVQGTTGAVGLADLNFELADYTGGTTVFYGLNQPATAQVSVGDLWYRKTTPTEEVYETLRWDGSAWVMVYDQGVTDAVGTAIAAQQAAALKATTFTQPSPPAWSGPNNSAVWFDTANGNAPYVWDGTTFVPMRFGNGAMEPKSLVASDVVATGTITGTLLEAVLLLASTVVAGPVEGSHTEMASDGLHVFQMTADGLAEVGRLGTSTNDFFAVTDANGQAVAQISDVGDGSFAGRVTASAMTVGGDDIGALLDASTPLHWLGSAAGALSGITNLEQGLVEVAVTVRADHMYMLFTEVSYARDAAGTVAVLRVRDAGTATPTVSTTPVISQLRFADGNPNTPSVGVGYRTWKPTVDGVHRLLLTASTGGTGTIAIDNTALANNPQIAVLDLGPWKPTGGSVNRGGGATPDPIQSFDTGYIAPAGARNVGYWSYRGNGTLRQDTFDVVQGLDPTGANGDGRGAWKFNIPNLPVGSVDRVDFQVYVNSTYYTSGGAIKVNLTNNGATGSPVKLTTEYQYAGYPNPGLKTITLPAAWTSFFEGKTSIAVTCGPGASTNLTYYIRFKGDSARLRIWYTK